MKERIEEIERKMESTDERTDRMALEIVGIMAFCLLAIVGLVLLLAS